MAQVSGGDVAWNQTCAEVNSFVKQYEERNPENIYTGITKSHWKTDGSSANCHGCTKGFGLLLRSSHCRKCGELFCKTCLLYQKRLNNNAHPDPNGKLYKVCKTCFDEGPQTIGICRNHRDFLSKMREEARHQKSLARKATPRATAFNFREMFDFDEECSRIQRGFEMEVQASILHKGKRLFSKQGDWKKSRYAVYGNMSNKCHDCKLEFNKLTVHRHHCAVCGAGVCDDCSSKNMIVYIPNNRKDDSFTPSLQAKIGIINNHGCPDKEPELCEYMRVCNVCSERVKAVQIQQYELTVREERVAEHNDSWLTISVLNEKLRSLKDKIDEKFPMFIDIIESVLDESVTRGPGMQIMRLLAKAQGDLSDLFTKLVTAIGGIKKLKPQTTGQTRILKNLFMGTHLYYSENICLFREKQRQFESVMTADSLTAVQNIMNQDAMNSCYITVKQLLLEVIHLQDKHSLAEGRISALVQQLLSVEKVGEGDLREAISEDWKARTKQIDTLVQQNLKDHRLIRPSKRLTAQYGTAYIESILVERSIKLVSQMYFQLNTKSAEIRFQSTKSALKDTTSVLEDLPNDSDSCLLQHSRSELEERGWEIL